MDTLKIDGWTDVDIPCYEVRGVEGHGAAIHLDRTQITELLPYMHEVHNRFMRDNIAFIDDTNPVTKTIRIEFTVREMDAVKMRSLLKALLDQAIAIHDQREAARSRKDHPAGKGGKTKAKRSGFRNVPPQVKTRR